DKPASDEPVTQRMLWDALDAGEDPTVADGDDGVGGGDGAKPGSSH
ncbi:MAG: TIGR02234 family membrane protein, partial [Rhodococcus sp. (in: high G+C Gram-positive bacteria)]